MFPAEESGQTGSSPSGMWYNLPGMGRRCVVATLLVVFGAQLLAGLVFASVCLEPCPDDGDERTCPPVCSLCIRCTHAQQAIVSTEGAATSLVDRPHLTAPLQLSGPSKLPADIFHVPLFG